MVYKMPRQYLQDFIARASQWFHFNAPEVPPEAIPWVLAVDYFYNELHTKYAAYEPERAQASETHTDPSGGDGAARGTVLFFRRPQAHEVEQDIWDYSRIITARVRTLELPTKHLLESILAELPDPAEFKAFIDKLIDGSDSISEVSEDSDGSSIHSSYVSSDDDINADNAVFLDDFIYKMP
jgi:hypothetical protein